MGSLESAFDSALRICKSEAVKDLDLDVATRSCDNFGNWDGFLKSHPRLGEPFKAKRGSAAQSPAYGRRAPMSRCRSHAFRLSWFLGLMVGGTASLSSSRQQEFRWWESCGSAGEPGDVQVVEGDLFFVPEDVMSATKQHEVAQPCSLIPINGLADRNVGQAGLRRLQPRRLRNPRRAGPTRPADPAPVAAHLCLPTDQPRRPSGCRPGTARPRIDPDDGSLCEPSEIASDGRAE
jgi:hypothetical protein